MQFGLRFQLAFLCYALGALCLHPQASPDEQARCRQAMTALIDRMLQRRVWAYWAMQAPQRRLPLNPLATANAQYGGHLAMMIGVYEAVGGDQRYDEPFTLVWSSDDRFVCTHTRLVDNLVRQMRSNDHSGVECDPGMVQAMTMAHVLWGIVLHDYVHGSNHQQVTTAWLDYMQARLVLRGLRRTGRGIFHASYTGRIRLVAPFGSVFLDGWALALLAGQAPALVADLAPRFWRNVHYVRTEKDEPLAACIPTASMWAAREEADQGAATGFGYVLAVEQGLHELADALLRYADMQLAPIEQDGGRSYAGSIAPPFTTALFALGEAGGLSALAALLSA